MSQFHLSLPCHSVEATTEYYVSKLEAIIGRNREKWVDINLFGNQITFTQCGPFNFDAKYYRFENEVLPSFHFGVIMENDAWDNLFKKLLDQEAVAIDSNTYLTGKRGEHRSFFVKDPNDYFVEFKSFKDSNAVFLR